MIEIAFFGVIALFTFIAISNWRVGLYLAIFADVMRDPVRKLSESQSVLLTVVGAVVWGGVLLGALNAEGKEMWAIFRRYRKFATALNCMILSLIPGAILSMILYDGGYKLVVIGLISYLGPLIGIAVGFLLPVKEQDIYRVFRFYALINAVALIGTAVEASGYTHRVLGGIEMDWLRQHEGLNVVLRAGVYRSPDIMGLHAAHVIVFSMMLGLKSRGPERMGWVAMIFWGLMCVLWSGRRKMVGIPLVFLASYLGIGMLRGSQNASRLATLAILLALGGTVGLFSMKEQVGSSEYTQYAATLFTEGGGRAKQLIGDSIIHTLYQSGVLGAGIGSATQGAHYAAVDRGKAWQEDGASRLFKELGVPGVILMFVAAVFVFQAVQGSLRLIPPQHPLAMKQIGVLGIVLGNVASFTISHQQYSGDPGSAILAVMMLGMVMGIPRVYYNQKAELERRRAARESAEEKPEGPSVKGKGPRQPAALRVSPQGT
ncbi:MAG: hypothetical protein KDA66_01770 [Planctomycetaceae bacterium]|nr:hypothetical protein [Planctomycetaceae bacterium]